MGIKIALCLCCVFFSACATSRGYLESHENEKKYAVSYCLSRSYPHTEFSKDAGHISGAYLQKGDFGLDMYEQIRIFVDSYKDKKYLSKHGRNLYIMQCIDLFESEELAKIIEKAANKSIQPTAEASAD